MEPLGGGTYLEEQGLWVWDVRLVVCTAHPFHLNLPASWLVPRDKHLPLSASLLYHEGLYSAYEPEQ